jgi:prepilin-type N-terminal cleavage/methylation domain-containing protein
LGKYNLAKNSKLTLKSSLGFTLIELITVIGIISVLAVIAISALDPLAQFQKSTDARKKSDLAQIQKALELYYQDSGRYPETDSTSGVYVIKSNDASGTKSIKWGDSWQPYMNILPKASDATTYAYFVDESQGGQAYYLYASLSRGGKDSQACNASGDPCPSAVTFGLSNACGGTCNYAVTSANVNP